MNTRLVRETSCVHGYFQDCTFLLDSGEPCTGGTSREVTVEEKTDWCSRHESPLIHDSAECDYSLENEYCVTICSDVVEALIVLGGGL